MSDQDTNGPDARPFREWHEDMGSVLWWTRPVSEAPYCGTPLDDTWPGYHRWFTPLPALPANLVYHRRYRPPPAGLVDQVRAREPLVVGVDLASGPDVTVTWSPRDSRPLPLTLAEWVAEYEVQWSPDKPDV